VESQLIRELPAERAYATTRARVISLLGPVTVVAGIAWAIVQPYRLTLLHPRGQGFWWLAIEPPLLVMFAGAVFAVFVARPLVADLEEDDGAA
jgi:formate hydrogenlyase subunit 3/multisubunit Na+/H+ antiporter MnhD subunit